LGVGHIVLVLTVDENRTGYRRGLVDLGAE
jgi:hypothetical protein